MCETRRPIPRLQGYYEACACGEIWRVKKSSGASVGRPLKKRLNNAGYYRVNLSVDGVRHDGAQASHLVAEAFHGPRQEGMQVNHKNGERLDDRPENIEWVTPSEQHWHRYHVLRSRCWSPEDISSPGESNPAAKLTREEVQEIRERYAEGGVSQQSLADEFGVHQTQVSRIVRHDSWDKSFV